MNQYWYITWMTGGGSIYQNHSEVIDMHPVDWVIERNAALQDTTVHLVFAVPITQQQYERFDE